MAWVSIYVVFGKFIVKRESFFRGWVPTQSSQLVFGGDARLQGMSADVWVAVEGLKL